MWTSKARMMAYSFLCSSIVMVLRMCFLWMGPMLTVATGIGGLQSFKKARRASSDPRVEAWTDTPRSWVSMPFRILSTLTASFSFSISSSEASSGMVNRYEPATAWSSSVAEIFTPWAARISLWCTYSPLTRISFRGWGVRSARMWVMMGPLRPPRMMVSPSRSTPFTRITSMVCPRPSMIFTSRITQSSWSFSVILSCRCFCVSCVISSSRSGMPSPVCADVGTSDTYFLKSLFFQ
mmetsp:Transcript_67047/g.112235  ORF Transcript_67047/g.112235 Transcript_67047/m.112235 type:complete len:237 (+) Transcript_67047:620-1330(+)